MFISLEEYKTKKKIKYREDFEMESMLDKAIQEQHKQVLKRKENELLAEKMKLSNALTEVNTEIKALKGKLYKENLIPKTKYNLYKANREELLLELNELVSKNHKALETINCLNNDIKQQTLKFKEREQRFKDEIFYLELQLKNSQTEVFKKLMEDNKRLMEQNTKLMEKCKRRKNELHKYERQQQDLLEKEKNIKLNASKELNEVQKLKEQLLEQLNIIQYKKYLTLY